MRLFNRLFHKKEAGVKPAPDPLVLRRQLLDLAAAGDQRKLLALCTANRALILHEFPNWTNIKAFPDIDPTDRQQLQYVIDGLGIIAQIFHDQLHEPSLWNLLTQPRDNPIQRFNEAIEKARTLLAEMQFDSAIELLTGQLIDSQGCVGPAADVFRSYAHGILGHALFQSGHASDAIAHYRQALSLCELQGDAEGIGVYLSSL